MNIYYLKRFRKAAHKELRILYNRRRSAYQIVNRVNNIPIAPLQEYPNVNVAARALYKERRKWVEMLWRIQVDKVSPKSIQNKLIARL